MLNMKFEDIVNNLNENLDKLVNRLIKSDYVERNDLKNINRIYVFFENSEPLYVGRTNKNRMKRRIQEHSKSYSNKNSASFAYLIYSEQESFDKNVKTDNPNFLKIKSRIEKMDIKYLEIDDEIIQTIFEPYLSYKLGTINKYNKFSTH